MMETETGEYMPRIHADNGSSISAKIVNMINSPLPWFCMLALVVIFMAWQCGQAKQAAFDAQTTALFAEQHFKDYSVKNDEYIEKLRFELASHGITPPEK